MSDLRLQFVFGNLVSAFRSIHCIDTATSAALTLSVVEFLLGLLGGNQRELNCLRREVTLLKAEARLIIYFPDELCLYAHLVSEPGQEVQKVVSRHSDSQLSAPRLQAHLLFNFLSKLDNGFFATDDRSVGA